MITKIMIRVNKHHFSDVVISSETKGRDLILEVERKIVPDSFDFCKPLVKSKLGYTRGHIDYIIERRVEFINIYT